MKQKLLSGITAIVMTASLSGYLTSTAFAEESTAGISLEIDQMTLTMDELAALNYTVPVYVNVTANSGFDVAEFGIAVDERCTYEADIKWLDYDDGFAVSNDTLVWRTLANHEKWIKTGSILKLDVTLPETTQAGDVYIIDYVEEAYKSHLWFDLTSGLNYTANGTFKPTDGYIRIVENEPKDEEIFAVGRDTWSFTNSYRYFDAGKYQLTDAHYAALTAGLSNKEKQKIDDLLTESWHGSCYGMASTSILACYDILKPETLQAGAACLNDVSVPLSAETKSLIYYYYALQRTDAVQQMLADAIYNQTEEHKLKKLISCLSDDSPTLLTYLDYTWGGHAVVAYDVQLGSYIQDGQSFNGKVLLYDNNKQNMQDEYCLYFNSTDWSWLIPAYHLSSQTGSFLGIITDDVNVINYHGYLDGTDTLTKDEYITILSSASVLSDFKIENTSDHAPGLTTVTADTIKAYAPLSGVETSHDVCFALPEADSGYVLTLDSEDAVSLSMDYENTLLKLEADAANTAEFDPSGMVKMQGCDSDYTMKLVFNEEICDDPWYSLTVEGQNADSASVKKTDAGYLLDASALCQVSVSAKNDDSCAVLGFTTESDSVLIYENENAGITAAADLDGDGTYESILAESGKLLNGDVSLDNQLSMIDVIALNQNLLAGRKLNTAQKQNADYNGDGIPTAADALVIMKELLK